MTKQVKAAEAPVESAKNDQQQSKNLYISVKTFDKDGKTIGERVVDMYHYGTRNWLQNHLWWAMHNDSTVETMIATDGEVKAYLEQSAIALQAKYAKQPELVAA